MVVVVQCAAPGADGKGGDSKTGPGGSVGRWFVADAASEAASDDAASDACIDARGTAAKFSEGLKKERCTAVACTCIQ